MTRKIHTFALIAVFALACGGNGEPQSEQAFNQFALANGGFFNGGGGAIGGGGPVGGGGGPVGGGGGGGLNVIGLTNEVIGGSGNTIVVSLLEAFGQITASSPEVWLVVEGAGINPNNLTLDIFDPGTTTPATGAAPVSSAFLGLSGGGILILEGVPTQDVDYLLTDTGSGNSGTVVAKFASQPSQQSAFSLLTPADAATGTPVPVSATPNFTWDADAGAVSYFVYCFGQTSIAGVFNGDPATTDLPFMVRTTGTTFDLASGAGATTVYESLPLPLTNAGNAPNYGWIAVSLDADGWQLNPAEFYFDMVTQ